MRGMFSYNHCNISKCADIRGSGNLIIQVFDCFSQRIQRLWKFPSKKRWTQLIKENLVII